MDKQEINTGETAPDKSINTNVAELPDDKRLSPVFYESDFSES